MTLLKRIFAEKRLQIILLGLAIAANAAMYGFVVRPLGVRSTGAARRAEAARLALQAAGRSLTSANTLVRGKARADEDLSMFYDKVLPASLPAARQVTYATLPALARRTNVRYLQSQTDLEVSKSQRIGHLKIQMGLQGEWEDVRRFIYELEASPSFVIIDDVTLAQNDMDKPLALTLDLSTYYRLVANGG